MTVVSWSTSAPSSMCGTSQVIIIGPCFDRHDQSHVHTSGAWLHHGQHPQHDSLLELSWWLHRTSRFFSVPCYCLAHLHDNMLGESIRITEGEYNGKDKEIGYKPIQKYNYHQDLRDLVKTEGGLCTYQRYKLALDHVGHVSVKTRKENLEDKHQSLKSTVFCNQDYKNKTSSSYRASLCYFFQSFPG